MVGLVAITVETAYVVLIAYLVRRYGVRIATRTLATAS